MGVCGMCISREKSKLHEEDNKEEDSKFELLKERIKKQSNKLHTHFKENVEETMNTELFFTMEKIKLVLSEFTDIVSRKIMNKNVDLTEEDFADMAKFITDLEEINAKPAVKKEKDYPAVLERYKDVIEKVKKISNEVIDNSDADIDEVIDDKPQNGKEENNKGNMKTKS
jgi:hypothetical protein